MARKKKIDPVEHQKRMIENNIHDNEKRIELGILRTPPRHRKFKVGDRVQYGAHRESYIREVYRDGMYYLIYSICLQRQRNAPPKNEFHVMEWHHIFPFETKDTGFRQEEKYYIRQSNSGISSLLHMTHRGGVDFDVEYQREHVWTTKDKIALIDSIFNNIDIGKFVFFLLDYGSDVFYEILDGKQRLSTLRDFYEDRFKYRGYYFSELSRMDKNKFEEHSVTIGYLENPNKHAIFDAFIKLNTCGKPMAKKHIDHVKKLLDELED